MQTYDFGNFKLMLIHAAVYNGRKEIIMKKRFFLLAGIHGMLATLLIIFLCLSINAEPTPDTTQTADKAVTASASAAATNKEMRAVWISFWEYGEKKYSKAQYTKYIDNMFNDCKAKGLNTVIVHVRPFADATYPSKYFPWSKYISGTAGKNPGFDPLKYAVTAAHKRGLDIHAWINPYRITKDTTKISSLPRNSIARKWATSSSASKRRRVLKYNGQLYFNPASSQVQNLIVNGVKEIVKKYKVDGIHFDDYFYPSLGTSYKKVFDAKEYNAYKKACKKKKKTPMSIVAWRRNNVNKLLKRVHTAVKSIRKKCSFGISPAGNIDNLYAKNNYYADVKLWMNSTKYIDYICPQIYWSFTQKVCPYKETVDRWLAIPRNSKVKIYIGIAAYRAGISKAEAKAVADIGWSKSNTILKRQVQYLRSKGCDGFALYSYSSLNRPEAKKELKNLQSIFN